MEKKEKAGVQTEEGNRRGVFVALAILIIVFFLAYELRRYW